jgi:hypothetical protein
MLTYADVCRYVDVSGRVFTGVRDILSTRRGMDEREYPYRIRAVPVAYAMLTYPDIC